MGSSTKRTEKTAAGAGKSAPARTRASGARKLPSPPRKGAAPKRRAYVAPKPAAPVARRAAPAKKAVPFVRKPVFEQLEPRLLLSADLNPLASDALFANPSTLPAEFRALADDGRLSVVTTAAVAPIQRTNELVFVDTATPDYQALIEDMRESAAAEGRNLQFVLIDTDADGILKITETLAQKRNVDAIHVISHAQDGAVQLGSAQLDFETLLKQATQIKSWGNALTEDGDILFYGCDLAASAEGKSLLDALSRLTGADVAASEDLTGAAAKGGDWQLEFRVGSIEAQIVVSADAQTAWDGVLAVPTYVANGALASIKKR